MTTLLPQRLRAAREALFPAVTQVDVAARLHRSKSAVSFWESGKTQPNADDLVELSKWFKVSVDWLLGIDRPMSVHRSRENAPPVFTVPVVVASSLQEWALDAPVEELQTLVAYPAGTAAAFQVSGEALASACPAGCYVVISKAAKPGCGDVVVASIPGSRDPIIRRLVEEGGEVMLVADDSRYPTRTLSGGVKIIGKAVEVVIRKML